MEIYYDHPRIVRKYLLQQSYGLKFIIFPVRADEITRRTSGILGGSRAVGAPKVPPKYRMPWHGYTEIGIALTGNGYQQTHATRHLCVMQGSYESIRAYINQNFYLSSPGKYVF
jgi:hypothetical protein